MLYWESGGSFVFGCSYEKELLMGNRMLGNRTLLRLAGKIKAYGAYRVDLRLCSVERS